MKTCKIPTKFSDQFVALDDKFLRMCFLLVVGLDAVEGSDSDNLLNFCTCDFSMRLRLANQVEMPSVHCFLDHSIVHSNLICIARPPLSSPCKNDLIQLCRPFLYT